MAKEYGKRLRLSPEEESFILERRKEPNKIVKDDKLTEDIRKAILSKPLSVEELCNRFNVPPKEIKHRLSLLKDRKYQVEESGNQILINNIPKQGAKHLLNHKMWQGDEIKFGFTADNHLCNHAERLDVLNLIYDISEDEGVSVVLNGGNWIDGEASFNKNELHTKGLTKQIDYAVKNYPFRKGIETWFVTGDDHEGWYSQREGINIGEYFQMKRENAGMFDLKHLGYIEADIEINNGKFEHDAWMRVMHAGGGSAYATSYSAQKIVESLQGGEKPSLLFIGHYHKLMYAYVRNVHTIQMGTTENQTIFMRKRKLEAHVGGGIVSIRRSQDGTINSVSVRFITAFDNKFYVGKDKYWK